MTLKHWLPTMGSETTWPEEQVYATIRRTKLGHMTGAPWSSGLFCQKVHDGAKGLEIESQSVYFFYSIQQTIKQPVLHNP